MKKIDEVDRDYLRRSKALTPTQRIEWLLEAHELYKAGVEARKKMKNKKKNEKD